VDQFSYCIKKFPNALRLFHVTCRLTNNQFEDCIKKISQQTGYPTLTHITARLTPYLKAWAEGNKHE
jgi:hypothetical protein